jgi:hypothetical protein
VAPVQAASPSIAAAIPAPAAAADVPLPAIEQSPAPAEQREVPRPPLPAFGAAAVQAEPQPTIEEEPFIPSESDEDPQPAAIAAPAPGEKPGEMIAFQGVLDQRAVHSICSPTLKPSYDEITPTITQFQHLQEDEVGFVRFTVRRAQPEITEQMQADLLKLQVGEPLEEQPAWRSLISSYASWLIQTVSGSKPAAPWAPKDRAKPPARHEQTEDHRTSVEFAREKVASRKYFESRLHIGVIGNGQSSTQQHMEGICASLMENFNASYSSASTGQGYRYEKCAGREAAVGFIDVQPTSLAVVSAPELGEMMKVPDSQTKTAAVQVAFGKRYIWPKQPIIVDDILNPPPGIIPFGEAYVNTSRQCAIGMPIEGLYTHAYICGTTGSGKSTDLEWILYGLARNNQSLFLIDPHGELVDNFLANLMAFYPQRKDDVILLDFGDKEWPISFNPIAITSASELEGRAASVKEMVLKVLNLQEDSAPRAVQFAHQATLALLEANLKAFTSHPDKALTLLHISNFLTDDAFRYMVMAFCTNRTVLDTFREGGTFDSMGPKKADAALPILRALGTLGAQESFSNIFGQSQNKVHFGPWVKENKIVLLKLPAIASAATQVATFIGAMATPMLIGTLESWKDDDAFRTFLVVDEFQNYATSSFKEILAQTRKWGLHAIAANQIPKQLPPDVYDAVMGNTSVKFLKRLDAQSSGAVAKIIAADQARPTAQDVVSMDDYWGWANIKLSKTESSGPFVYRGLAPPLDPKNPYTGHLYEQAAANRDRYMPEVIERSRLQVAVRREDARSRQREHDEQARAIMQRMIQERTRAGGWDGDATTSTADSADDYWS